MESLPILRSRMATLKKAFSRIKNIKLGGESPRLSMIQGYLSRGDRRVGEILELVVENEGDFPNAIRECEIDVSKYIYEPLNFSSVLPWDHINMHVSKNYLWNEYEKSLNGVLTEQCDIGVCKACGVC
jgi:hypothetical protein